jgi:hypothetical protein
VLFVPCLVQLKNTYSVKKPKGVFMNARSSFLLTITLLALAPQPAHASWIRSESVEWWTNVSDTITVMQVIEAKDLKPLDENSLAQQVTCGKPLPLKGAEINEATIRQDYRKTKETLFGDQQLLREIASWFSERIKMGRAVRKSLSISIYQNPASCFRRTPPTTMIANC